MLENLSTELDKTESRLDMVSKKVAQVLQLSDGNLMFYNYFLLTLHTSIFELFVMLLNYIRVDR